MESVPRRLGAIDFLRGVAALSVLCHHAINYSNATPKDVLWFGWLYGIVDYGHLGVPLFFVISGFCIHLNWARQNVSVKKNDVDFVGFWKRRIRRLYPPYVVALCISMSLVVTAFWLGRNFPLISLYPEPKWKWMMADFLTHALMLHGFHPIFDRAGGNPPFWTLAREEYFYLMYFVLLKWRIKWGAIRSALLALLLGISFQFAMKIVVGSGSAWWPLMVSSAIVLWIQWCLGVIAVEAHLGLVKLPKWCKMASLIPVWMTAAIISQNVFPYLSPLFWGMMFFTLLNYCVDLEVNGRWPENKMIVWLMKVGMFSYSIYLIHNPVRGVVKQLLGEVASSRNVYVYCLNTLLIIICGYFTGKWFFLLVESRFLNSRNPKKAMIAPRSSQGEVV